ncbi:hypothetical protein [Modestobacter versicolor]|uniref:hypothetical protein n=1 Tax=Modestobacter versicolor TaxID=429133 RepID=UPI0034DE149E
MRSRKGSNDEMPADDGGLSDWLHDLTEGAGTARQLRHRLAADSAEPAEACCPACDGAATGKHYFGLGGQLRGRRSA